MTSKRDRRLSPLLPEAAPRHRPDPRRRLGPRWAVGIAIGVVSLLVAVTVRAATERIPPLRVHVTLPRRVTLDGASRKIDWPSEGEAAVAVAGLGGASRLAELRGPRSDRRVPIASVAKVMTAYLTLRQHPLAAGEDGFLMTVSKAEVEEERMRVAKDESVVKVKAGEQLSERQALEALLLPSANNVAAMLSVHDAGSEAAFVAEMNEMAKRLHMSSTRYTDPSGFKRSTVSTASDQLKLARAAMALRTFASIVVKRSTSLPVAGEVSNYDGLAGEDGYVGVKTGSDEAAGGCLMFAKRLRVGGRRLTMLGVVLGQRDGPIVEAALRSSKRLGDSLSATVRRRTAIAAGTPVLTVRSVDGAKMSIGTAKAVRAIGWRGMNLSAHISVRNVGADLSAGERVATVSVPGGRSGTFAIAPKSFGGASIGWRLAHLL